jgi:hypothetical protein
VFQWLNPETAFRVHCNSTEYLVSLDQAQALLSDAESRTESAKGGLIVAYRGHVANLRQAIKGPLRIKAQLQASTPGRLDRWRSDVEVWSGTPAQLLTLGVAIAAPRQTARGLRWGPTTDSRGFAAKVRPDRAGLFFVEIEIPESMRKAAEHSTASLEDAKKKMTAAKRRLDSMATSHAKYREMAVWNVEIFVRMIRQLAQGRSELGGGGGYMLAADDRSAVELHLQGIRQAFKTGRVAFDQNLRDELGEQIMAPVRAADPAFGKM